MAANLFVTPTSKGQTATTPSTMMIDLHLKDTVLTATLQDSPSARAFLAMLPLTLTLEDFAATEKIAYLPEKLSTEGAPSSYKPAAGDLTYYAPWGNLAIFHKGAASAPGLVFLGRLDGGVDRLARPGAMEVTIKAR